jgi:hypothetical protein
MKGLSFRSESGHGALQLASQGKAVPFGETAGSPVGRWRYGGSAAGWRSHAVQSLVDHDLAVVIPAVVGVAHGQRNSR